MTSALLLLQLADSAFPTGGFAHSGGLEAATQLGEIAGAQGLERTLIQSLHQAARASLPLVLAAHADPSRLAELDHLCDAFTTGAVANRASRAQGRAWLAAAAAAFGIPALGDLRRTLRASLDPGHLAPVFGAVTAHLALARADAALLFLFLHLRGMVSSAVRLGLVGPLEAQSLQARLAPTLETLRARADGLTEADLATTAPLLDLFQCHHDNLYSRLFSS
ncbi:urease accessory protein UreF [Chondromyces apiculatus]|uniref:Urease accessory protein UreF n=1 Tax=Chondromyces apiculatus DSM 436 TaxID=1192034 RepID=A0A017SU31_9BACT|nr:urease accessory UreF family protein [Chondromyces apiculatus]EYF00085.1 Urease accessory protein UreF [Chondromyces apiculatus DSM 436]